MKVASVLFSLIFITITSAFNVTQVSSSIKGICESLDFDSDGNGYLIANNDGYRFLYKLNPSMEIQWTFVLSYMSYKLIINSRNDVFLLFSLPDSTMSLNLMDSKTPGFQEIDIVPSDSVFILDEEDNLFYNREDGVYLLRPKSTVPVIIKNLENFKIRHVSATAVDSNGNVYLAVYDWENYENSLAVITKESKHSEIPSADLISVTENPKVVNILQIDQNNNLWIFTTDFSKSGEIKLLTNGTLSTILTDNVYEMHQGLAVKNRMYVVSITNRQRLAPIFFINLENHETGFISDLGNVSYNAYFSTVIKSDSNGVAYFGTEYEYDKGPLVFVRSNDTESNGIDFGKDLRLLTFSLDGSEDLWVLSNGDGVYYVRNGETVAEKGNSSESDNTYFTDLVVNEFTNEVFVLSKVGLFFVR